MPRITNKTECLCSKRASKVECPGNDNHSVWYNSRVSDYARIGSHWKTWTTRTTETSETPEAGVAIKKEHLRPLLDCISPAANRRTYTWDTLGETYEGFILLDTMRPKARLSWRGGLTLHRLDISSKEWDKARTKVRESIGVELDAVKCPADWQPEDDDEHSGRFARTTSTRAASPTFGSARTGAHGDKVPIPRAYTTQDRVRQDSAASDSSQAAEYNADGPSIAAPEQGLVSTWISPFPLYNIVYFEEYGFVSNTENAAPVPFPWQGYPAALPGWGDQVESVASDAWTLNADPE